MKALIYKEASRLGFARIGITTADPVDELGHLESAIAEGRTASMGWLARDPESRCDPRSLLPGAKSVICAAYPYGGTGITFPLLCKEGAGEVDLPLPSSPYKGEGDSGRNVARFARGADYHDVVMDRLRALLEFIRKSHPDARAKLCVDTSPIMEKALAARAGLGWIGKHTILVNRNIGSWFVLGEIITDIEFEVDSPAEDLCADCRACIDACPTVAIRASHELDARRCLSYLTIEHRGSIPDEFARHIASGQYGCDLCQEACRYNRHGARSVSI